MFDRLRQIIDARAVDPGAVAAAAARRSRAVSVLGDHGRAMIIAADHPARGALAVGGDPLAMADRGELLRRLCVALERPGVTGVLGTADVLEDLLLLGALEGKAVFGSMNRGGLAGSAFEADDRFTGYDAQAVAGMRFDGGKMLLRIVPEDADTAFTLAGAAQAVNELADRGLTALVEPFWAAWEDGRLRNDLSAEAVVRSVAVASGLGRTSAYTWLKLPVVAGMERVLAATTLPVLLLGGEVSDTDAAFASWAKALDSPQVRGLVVGRSLLYPPGGDVANAVDRAVALL
ncbi:Cgl0159 family (beta/alpha)8-fold protein [Actinomadura hibisca]|uniref:Cgl0159 family (beta/alpha)8-fold protein n=1 Tax=Actinomadura hibisca TaxID=68565 RepID=UPI000832DEB1|nr:aldolase [Actinomadura hibisca]